MFLKRCYLFFYFAVQILFFTTLAYSEGDNGAGAFSRTPIGTRSAAMGHAFTAVADDASAFYHNPAAIGGLTWAYLSFNGQYLHSERYFGTLAFVDPSVAGSSWALGVAVNYMTYPGVSKYDLAGNYTGKADNRNDSLYFTVSKGFGANDTFRLGANFKVLNEKLDSVNSFGGGMDLGMKLSITGVTLGMMLQDIITAEKYSNRNTPVYFDRVLKLGVATALSDSWKISLQLDKNLSTTNNVIFRVGGYFRIWQAKGSVDYGLDQLEKFEKKDKNNFDKLLKGKKTFQDEIYLNVGYGDGKIGFGTTLKNWGLKFDLSANFSVLHLNRSIFLLTVDVPLY